jgi:spermidine synthase
MKKSEYFFEGVVPFEQPAMKVGFRIRKKLYEGKSRFQKIKVFNLYTYGNTLMLDDIVQTTVNDEFIYHEMLCQVPMFTHPSPKNVLIIGGGDGGALEEVLKHRLVKKAVMVEIDGKVIEISKKYLPSISKNAFKDKRTTLIIGDGKKYIEDHEKEFDVVILDLSDPDGPAKDLISLSFYGSVKKALKKNGIVSLQSGSFTTQPGLVSTIFKRLQKIFSYVEVRRAGVPAYQAGEYSFTLASDYNFTIVSQKTLEKKFNRAKHMNLQYWSPDIHVASAILPKYLKTSLAKS